MDCRQPEKQLGVLVFKLAAVLELGKKAWKVEPLPAGVEDLPWYRRIVTDDGEGISVGIESRKGDDMARIEVGGIYPHNHSPRECYGSGVGYGESNPSITLDAKRDPDKLAKEIERRLLVRYRELRPLCLKHEAEANQYEANTRETRRLLADAFGVPVTSNRSGSEAESVWVSGVQVQAFGEGCKLEFRSIPRALGVKLAKLYAEAGSPE